MSEPTINDRYEVAMALPVYRFADDPERRRREASLARRTCAREADYARSQVRILALQDRPDIEELQAAVGRLGALLARVDEMDGILRQLLQGEVDASPIFAGGTVEPDGSISGVPMMNIVDRLRAER